MLTPPSSLALGLTFVLLGGVNVWLVLEAWSRTRAAGTSSRMLTLHRIGGYLFIAVFCVMTYFMVARLHGGTENSAAVAIHLTLAMLLAPLLFIKVLIARYYRSQHNLLMPLGLMIFVLSFVLIASTAGPYLVQASRMQRVSIGRAQGQAVTIDLNRASDVMQRRCSKCHNLDRVVGAQKDAEGWRHTVNRMRALPAAGISEAEAQTIVWYLAWQSRPKGSEQSAKMAVERALVDQRCSRCHSLDRVYENVKTPEEWRRTVARMLEYAAGSGGALQPGEDRQIIDYLIFAQTPEAAKKRKAQAEAAVATGNSLPSVKNGPAAALPAPGPPDHAKTVGIIAAICLAATGLAIRRPAIRRAGAAESENPVKTRPAVQPRLPGQPCLLQLVQVTQQTKDSKTLRFTLPGGRRLDALPGQFLAFSFLFDGRKETRCYSICSSTARSGYIEITPKRVQDGCVSVFLNDRASIGMTVEATGPFGQFCLNSSEDRKIVLLAAGSGITPIIAMLRYIEDLCLEIDATLLYFVRTREDIMFRQEFENWGERSKNFRCHLMLSQPDADWKGARGHIDMEFVRSATPEIEGRTFFLCGPPPFMVAARKILMDLRVPAEQIRYETFGGSGAQPNPASSNAGQSGFAIEFSRSGKATHAPEGQTLLEAAGAAGVNIPSACRQGLCGTCKTRLLKGQVEMTVEDGLDAESKAQGFILTCVGHAAEAVRLDA